MLTSQIPNTIEVVSNNETMWIRTIKIKNRDIILRKSRLPITKENVDAYIILELFTNMDMKKYYDDASIQREIVNYIKNRAIKEKDVFKIAGAFPSKTIRKIMESGIIDEFA